MSMVKFVKFNDDARAELNSIDLSDEAFDDVIKRLTIIQREE